LPLKNHGKPREGIFYNIAWLTQLFFSAVVGAFRWSLQCMCLYDI